MKLGTYVYFSVSMTIKKAYFPITTTSLLKLGNHAMHGGETWYTRVFQRFYDDLNKKWPQALFSVTTSSLLKFAHHTMHGGETYVYFSTYVYFNVGTYVYFSVSMTTTEKLPRGLFPITTSSLLKLVHRTMHAGETWYACVFQRFHDNHCLGHFPYNYFFTSQTCKPCNAWK